MTQPPPPSTQRPSSAAVLLVDDSPSNLLALEAVLGPLRVRTVGARSGREALALIAQEPFAVALVDVQMPEMDGFELTRRMRLTEYGRELPVVFVTAIHRDEQYVKKGYAAGGADYITKPYDPDIVRARVKAFVDLYEQRESVRRGQVALRTHERDEAVRRLVALERIATAALETNDLSALLHELLQAFTGAADGTDFASIFLRDREWLELRASVGLAEEVSSTRLRVGEGFVGRIASSRRPTEIVEAADVPWLRGRASRLHGVPLLFNGEVLGVACIGARSSSTFSEAEKRLLSAAAERAALAVGRHLERSRLHDVLSEAPARIAIVRLPDYEYEFVNPSYAALFDSDPLGTRLEAGAFARVIEGVERAAAGHVVHITELEIAPSQSSTGAGPSYFRVTLQPLRNSSGTPDRVLIFAVDVTLKVRARQEIEATQAARAELLERERAARRAAEFASTAKDEFLATVSHELRTPLNAILGWASLAGARATGDAEHAFAIIERNARTQARIVEDVLDFSRIARGKMRLSIASVDLELVVREAIEAVRLAAEAKGVTIEVTMNVDKPVSGDADRLQQVVWNLLSNAVKFTNAGGRVHVSCSSSDSTATLQVVDTGQGIEPDFVQHVFEAFRQANGSTTRRAGGLGLGLSIVRQIVQAHGGSIQAESEGVGRGATFTVELPLETRLAVRDSRPGSMPVRLQAGLEGGSLQGLRVLIVEDEEDSRELLRQMMNLQGAEVVAASSVQEAVFEFERFKPDVVVSDIAMPEADGYDFIRKLRSLPPEQGGLTPAVAVTAHAQKAASEQALEAGFQRYLSKPIDADLLVTTIAGLSELGSRLREGSGKDGKARQAD